MPFKLATRDLDLEVAEPRNLHGLGKRGVGGQERGNLDVGRALLGLLKMLGPDEVEEDGNWSVKGTRRSMRTASTPCLCCTCGLRI